MVVVFVIFLCVGGAVPPEPLMSVMLGMAGYLLFFFSFFFFLCVCVCGSASPARTLDVCECSGWLDACTVKVGLFRCETYRW